MKKADLERLRTLCLALPEATERVSHGEPAWFVRKAPQFASLADRHHDDRVAFWAAAPPGAQQDWVQRDPGRFFVPPYVGGRGWIGVYLDVPQDWDDVADIVEDAYRAVAPKTLIARLDAGE
ncbi:MULTISPECIES: MmcQ/YjbR family DNA-binding protein [Rhodococcus]|uniref:MmcQ/YjbR family DNA-binding protein n=1 Tax=Rhodococcus jostii TaxID=132919 RepID=A0ABU4CQF7_RHOJO|nr:MULTISPECIES: MmcQ/YjbR family DNA-binding protein [Rhodococcus]MDI9948391.1 MmcQ/YjbR family DNA-binding protein [Rhodococcus sp. IEGM 1305]MDI9972422.1 MmcQ/YjbR family DNA-binding protein [Rhodococcus sp. IEGM 1307]MDV6285503.1 MmcQ/YjbR family DNA-binding protein [Rhodococcus jostii]